MPELFGAGSLAGSGDDEAAATREVLARGSLDGAGSTTATVPPLGGRWRVVVTDIYGAVLGELEKAVISPIDNQLNKAETWSFTILQNDPKAALILDLPFRECQIWRGDQILAWGPMVRVAVNKQNIVVNCQGALWHLGRRNIGKADRTNYVLNGDFEDGLANWGIWTNDILIYYNAPHAQVQLPDATIVSFPTVTGSRALRLENFVSGCNAGANQAFRFTPTAPVGSTWTMKGYCYVETLEPGDEAFEDRALYMGRYSTTELNPDPLVQAAKPGAPRFIEHAITTVDADTPKNQWIRQECEFTIPPGGAEEGIEVGIHAPNGVVYWDAITLTLIERLAFYGVDQTAIAQGIVEHLQDGDYDKSTANISTDCQPSGVLRTREYVHSEHPPGLASIEEFTTLDNGFDFSMQYTPTQRIFTTHFPRRGSYKPEFGLTLGENIADFTWAFDGESASNSVIVLGSGNGSDREEGFAENPSAFADEITLEQVYAASPDTNIDSLDNMAAERLAVAQNPVSLQVRTTRPTAEQADPIGLLWPGDTVPVTIQRHALNIDTVYRVVSVGINPDNTVSLNLNLRTEA